MHLTLGILAKISGIFLALSFFWLDGFAVPAPAQVTQTVGRLRRKYKTALHRFVLQVKFVFLFSVVISSQKLK